MALEVHASGQPPQLSFLSGAFCGFDGCSRVMRSWIAFVPDIKLTQQRACHILQYAVI